MGLPFICQAFLVVEEYWDLNSKVGLSFIINQEVNLIIHYNLNCLMAKLAFNYLALMIIDLANHRSIIIYLDFDYYQANKEEAKYFINLKVSLDLNNQIQCHCLAIISLSLYLYHYHFNCILIIMVDMIKEEMDSISFSYKVAIISYKATIISYWVIINYKVIIIIYWAIINYKAIIIIIYQVIISYKVIIIDCLAIEPNSLVINNKVMMKKQYKAFIIIYLAIIIN